MKKIYKIWIWAFLITGLHLLAHWIANWLKLTPTITIWIVSAVVFLLVLIYGFMKK